MTMQQQYKLAMSKFRKELRSTSGHKAFIAVLRAGSFKGISLSKFWNENSVRPVSIKIWIYLDDKLTASS